MNINNTIDDVRLVNIFAYNGDVTIRSGALTLYAKSTSTVPATRVYNIYAVNNIVIAGDSEIEGTSESVAGLNNSIMSQDYSAKIVIRTSGDVSLTAQGNPESIGMNGHLGIEIAGTGTVKAFGTK